MDNEDMEKKTVDDKQTDESKQILSNILVATGDMTQEEAAIENMNFDKLINEAAESEIKEDSQDNNLDNNENTNLNVDKDIKSNDLDIKTSPLNIGISLDTIEDAKKKNDVEKLDFKESQLGILAGDIKKDDEIDELKKDKKDNELDELKKDDNLKIEFQNLETNNNDKLENDLSDEEINTKSEIENNSDKTEDSKVESINTLNFSNNTKMKDLKISNEKSEIDEKNEEDNSSLETNNSLTESTNESTKTNSKIKNSRQGREIEKIESTLKPRKPSPILAIVFIIILLGGLGFFIFKDYIIAKKDNDDKNLPTENTFNAKNYKYTHLICKKEYGNDDFIIDKQCDTDYLEVKTEVEEAEMLYVDPEYLYALLNDNGLKLYNLKTNDITKLSIGEINLKGEFSFNFSNDKSKVVGIIYNQEASDYSGYYNLESKSEMFLNKYKTIRSTSSQTYLTATKEVDGDLEEVLINIKTNKEEFSGDAYYEVLPYKDKNYIFVTNDSEDEENLFSYNQTVYTEDKLKITDVASNYQGREYGIYDGNLYVFKNGQIKKYDINGKLLGSRPFSEKQFRNIVNNKILYVDKNNYFSVYDFDTSKKVEIFKFDDNYTYDTVDYYGSEDFASDENKKSGIYISIYYKNGKDENGYYGKEYCYTDSGEILTYNIEHEIGGRAKPVLYLYPTKKTNITISFKHPEYLTTTYPKYKDKWEVVASPNGDLYDEKGNYYYALYWDEIRYHEVDFKEGFYVTKDKAIDFLEEKLTTIGLNSRERNEFIMYWLPILEKNNQSLVYFELTSEREKYNQINIEPKPDSLLRVSIHIKKVNNKIAIKEQKLKTFERNGFTAIEWGGMTY